jgi:hypothetical protein
MEKLIEEATMERLYAGPAHRQIRAEMRSLDLGPRFHIPEVLLALLASTSVASACLSLIRF